VFYCKFEAVVEHYKWAPYVKARHLLAALQGWASHVLHGVSNGAMYEETIEALEDHFGVGTWLQHTTLS
jgi:hypothetical protein